MSPEELHVAERWAALLTIVAKGRSASRADIADDLIRFSKQREPSAVICTLNYVVWILRNEVTHFSQVRCWLHFLLQLLFVMADKRRNSIPEPQGKRERNAG